MSQSANAPRWVCEICAIEISNLRTGWLWLDQEDIREAKKPHRWHVQHDACRAADRERVGTTREYELYLVSSWEQVANLRSELSRLLWFEASNWDQVVGQARIPG